MKIADAPDGGLGPLHPGLPEEGRPSSSWWRRHGLALGLGLLATFAGVIILVEVGPSGLVGFAPRSRPAVISAGETGFDKVVRHIYDVTNQAFQQRRADLLDDVYNTNCQCHAQARAVIDHLLSSHQVLGGQGTQVVSVEVLKLGPGVALLRVRDKVDPFPVRTEQGVFVARQPGRSTTPFTFTLEQRNGRWLLTDVVPEQGSLP